MCEAPTVYRPAAYRARTPKPCAECGRTIHPGELYEHVWGVWEGEPDSYHTCAECFEVRAELWDDLTQPDSGLYLEEVVCDLAFGNLREALAEQVQNYAPLAA